MEPAQLIHLLSATDVYSHPVPESIEVHQTHISVVFLAGPYAYKIKKPLNLGFLDFSTLEKRRHFCLEEVRLNRRLAPKVYLDVVPIAREGERLRIGGRGEVVEWAVRMVRLPEECTLASRLERDEVAPGLLDRLGRRIAAFHAEAAAGPAVSAFGRFEVVARNARENLEQTRGQVGRTVSAAVHGRLRELLEATLSARRDLIEGRALRGLPRDTHGDLHLDHVYVFPDAAPPDDLVIVDCIEFSERFRYSDPMADLAFLVMDLIFFGRKDLASVLVSSYVGATGDREGTPLLPLYVSYRAAVRAKVDGFEAAETEVPEEERCRAEERARAHWLLALGALADPPRRPCLLFVAGLPGTGKSALARDLASAAGLEYVSSDLVRKELAGLSPGDSARAEFGEGIYTPEWTQRTYAECRRRAEELLLEGKRVIVDANFREDARRREFVDLGRRYGVPVLLLLRTADPAIVGERLARRQDDASDADWAVYRRAAETWEPMSKSPARVLREIPAFPKKQDAAGYAMKLLTAEGLLQSDQMEQSLIAALEGT